MEIGLKIGSTIEYIPIGIYNIDDIEKTDYTIKITAFDNMIKFEKGFITSLGDNLTLQQVVSEVTRITGVEFTGNPPTSYTVKKLEGFTCREVLGYVASLCGGNAVITRDGKFTIVTPTDVNYSIGTSNYFDYIREETKYKIGKISCQAGEEVLSKGSLGADSMELQFENPWINTTILTDIYNKLNGFEYLGYSMKWQGDLSLDAGDIVTITDKKGVVRKHPILSQKFTYTGGLTSEIGAKGENKNKNEFSSSGSTAKKVERVVTELALINKALIDVAYIGDLTAGNIKFDTASGGTLDLQTLLAKHITGENGQFLNITSSNVVIANAVIKDAMIDSLSLNKLKAGTINTNNINLASSDGGLSIVGPTMQFKDNSNRVRLQLGQDTAGDFNFILRAPDGTTTLIDGYGIKEKAIADKLIKSNMVADGAIGEQQINYSSLVTGLNKDTNTSLIKASKVAIDLTGQSLEVSFNSLKSSVNGLDEKIKSNTTSITVAQGKIDVLLSESSIIKGDVTTLKDNYTSIKATVDGINTTVASHTTTITNLGTNVTNAQNIADSKAKVFTSTPTTPYKVGDLWVQGSSGEIMKCKVTRASGTYNSADWEKAAKYTDDSKANSVEGSLNTLGGRVTTVESNYSTLSQDISGFKTTVSNTYSTKTELETLNGTVTNLTSRIATAENKITADAIVSTVRSSTAYTTDLNGKANQSSLNTTNSNVSGLTTRVSTVEQSITATAITTTISSAINGGTSSITTTQFVMDKTGLTIKNGALTIRNKAGNNVLTADVDGNLFVQNSLTVGGNTNGNIQVKNTSNVNIFSVSKNGILLQDGTMRVTTGAIDWGSVGSYPDGETKDMIVYANGLSINRTTYAGSQKLIFNARYNEDSISLIEDNRENSTGTYYETIINTRSITSGNIYLSGVSKTYNGYNKLPNGMTLQWGESTFTHTAANTYLEITIKYPFSFNILKIFPILQCQQSTGSWNTVPLEFMLTSWDYTGFKIKYTAKQNHYYRLIWFAIGN